MKLTIKNFRSIKDQEIELAPITVVYGHNGSGKSSLLYAPMVFKNIVVNPSQERDDFFHLGFANLGPFESVVYNHKVKENIEIAFSHQWREGASIEYRVQLASDSISFIYEVHPPDGLKRLLVEPSNTRIKTPYSYSGKNIVYILLKSVNSINLAKWNGILAQEADPLPPIDSEKIEHVMAADEKTLGELNTIVYRLQQFDMVPLKRGFTKPYFVMQSTRPLTGEDKTAALLTSDKYLLSKVSRYLEKITGRDIRINIAPGTGFYSLDTTDKKTGVTSELVNDGFGVNQLVYALTTMLSEDNKTICIEEPEIHLHPSAVRSFCQTLVEIQKEEGKHFIISTHSEVLISALLALVAGGKLKAEDLACYHAVKAKKATNFERQNINEKGQIEGGLATFIEAELEDLKTFLKISE